MVTKSNNIVSKRSLIEVLETYAFPQSTTLKSGTTSQQGESVTKSSVAVQPNLEELTQQLRSFKSVQEKFIFACSNGSDEDSSQLLSSLLEQTSKIDRIVDRKNGNVSLLHILAAKNKVRSMEIILSHKVKVDSVDSVHSTPLFHAITSNSADAVALLLSKGANVNFKDTWGKFPLLISLKNKHYQIAELLCAHHGIDVHLRSIRGNTALHIVAADGDLQGVRTLMEKGKASPQRRNNDEDNVLQHCLAHPHIVQYICANTEKRTLTKLVTNVNINGCNLLHEVAKSNHFPSLITVLKSLDLSELSMNQVNSLLNSQDTHGETPLIIASKQSNADVVRFLCQCTEMKVNEGDYDGNTALYHAASAKNTDVVEMITSVGGSFKADNKKEETDSSNAVISCIRSMKTLLSVILSATAIVCVITIAVISIGFFASNVSKSSATIRTKYFEEVVTSIGRQVEDLTLGFKMAFTSPKFNVTDSQDVLEHTTPVLLSTYTMLPLVTFLYCNKANKAISGWAKTDKPTEALYFDNYNNYSISYVYEVNDFENYRNLSRFSYSTRIINDIPTPDYIKNAMNSRDIIWTPSYTSNAYAGYLYLTLGRGFRDPETDEFLGSCQFDSDTSSLNTYLFNNANQQDSVTVVLEGQTGYLIGTSDPSVLLYNQTENGQTVRFDGSRTSNKRMNRLLNAAREKYGGTTFSDVGNRTRVFDKFRFNGQNNALNIGVIKNNYGLHWIVVQGLPMSNFYQRFYNSIIVMVCATVGLLVVSVIVSILIATLFMRPIQILINQAEAVKLLQLEQVEVSLKHNKSFFSEIASLQGAFSSMTSRLKQFRNFIPDHILAVIEAEIGAKAVALNAKDGTTGSQPATEQTKTHTGDTMTGSRGSFSGSRKANAADMVSQALNSALTSGNVTVMTIKLPDFSQVLEMHGSNEIDETSKELLSQFMDVIRISKGQFVSITSSKAVVAWNTFIKQSDHQLRACKAARSCMESLKKMHVQWKTDNLPLLEVSIGIANDTVYYGNMGTDRMKFFTLVGSAVKRSAELCKIGSKWGAAIVCDANIHVPAREEYNMRPMLSKADDEQGERSVVYELGDLKSSDAWVNELGDNKDSKDHVWKQYNEAFSLAMSGQHEEAYELFVKYLEKNMQDIAAHNMIGICRSQKETGTGTSIQSDPTATLVD